MFKILTSNNPSSKNASRHDASDRSNVMSTCLSLNSLSTARLIVRGGHLTPLTHCLFARQSIDSAWLLMMMMNTQIALAILAWLDAVEGRALPQPQIGTVTAACREYFQG